ncbi:TPA: CBS domain-containing protein [Candidatus Woesearchaeota archaeon]|nr:CBS domain-containing protein [Candidatus Woesearchaeota archaeon]
MRYDLKSLKGRRQRLGLTQTQLAHEAGVSQSMIAKIEAGMLDPAYTKAQKIFEALERVEKKKEPKAKDVMAKKVLIVKPSDKIVGVVRQMSAKGISQMPVVEAGSIVGMLTERAVIDRVGKEDVRRLLVKDVMEEMPPIVTEDTPISALNELLKHRNLVVVQKEGKIKGVVTKSDIIKSMI